MASKKDKINNKMPPFKPPVKNAAPASPTPPPSQTVSPEPEGKFFPGLMPAEIIKLQTSVGNQAVSELISHSMKPVPDKKQLNNTGIPTPLKAGMENLSGESLDDVKVHYNSPEPAKIHAAAFTRNNEIHLGPGQKSTLPHEAWHAVQQKEGRVPETRSRYGAILNDDPFLEKEAEMMGRWAPSYSHKSRPTDNRYHAVLSGNREAVVQCFVPKDSEQKDLDAALDKLLGQGIDPGGLRLKITTAAPNLDTLQKAVTTIIDNAKLPPSELPALITQLEYKAELLASLLGEATQSRQAGTPGLRLNRVLKNNPQAPRTLVALTPLLVAQKDIDTKILRGKISGGELEPDEVPSAEKRNLIGGHSPEILNDPSCFIESNVLNPNQTRYIGFRKLLRSDGGAFALGVKDNTSGNLVSGIAKIAGAVKAFVLQIELPMQNVPPKLTEKAAIEAFNIKAAQAQAKHRAFVTAVLMTFTKIEGALQSMFTSAPGAAAKPEQLASVKPFIDAVVNSFAHTTTMISVLRKLDKKEAQAAEAIVQKLQTTYESTGAVMSAKKNSTLAPAGWTEDEMLKAGDVTAAETPTLIRQDSSDNNPANGSLIETKHHKIIKGIVWVVMKEGVSFTKGVPPGFKGGKIISSFPTSLTSIPADKIHPQKDDDRFSTVPST